jgi:hypothetical protein
VRSAALAIAACAATLSGCSLGSGDAPGGSPAAESSPARGRSKPQPNIEVAALLQRRARALERGRAAAYAATSAPSRRAHDRAAAARSRGLGLRDVVIDLGSGRISQTRATLHSRINYRVRGLTGVFTSPATLRLTKGPNGWRVTSQRVRRQQPPWEVGGFRRTPSPHFVVWAPEGLDPAAGGAIAALEDGYARMQGVLANGRLRHRYLVLIAADARQARRLTSAIRGVEGLTALTDTEVRQEGPAERVRSVASQRLVILWPAFAALDGGAQRTVVAHELTHAAVAPETSGRTPSWLAEALALYVSGDRRVDEAAQVVARASGRTSTLARLSHPDAIAKLTGDAQTMAYAYSSAAAFYVVERYGRGRLLRLYDAFNDESLAGDGGDLDLVDAAVRKVLHVGLARFERELRAWIAAGGP